MCGIFLRSTGEGLNDEVSVEVFGKCPGSIFVERTQVITINYDTFKLPVLILKCGI